MSVTIHLCNETSAWQYLVPALFNFTETPDFSWEVCRYAEGYLDADKVLLRENEDVFSFIPPGCERYATKWLKLHGAPSSEIAVYCWGITEESPLKSIPFIRLPILREDLNGFLLHLKSVHTRRSLRSLLNERAVHPRDRIMLREILSEKLTASLGKQLAAAALLQPQPSLEANQEEEERSIDAHEEDESIEEETGDLWGTNSPTVANESLSSEAPIVQVARPQLVPKASIVYEPAEDHQPVIAEDSGNYPLEEIHGDFTESEHCPHWSVSFSDNLHLPLLNHIDQWGCITEVEVIQMLGSSRAARNFAVKLDQYAKLLPFEIKVQPSATGNRYMKTNN
jgi:hypothetical protein